MSDAYLGEVRFFTGNFAPRGWAFCDGQIMSISNNNALFALLGTTYGGDGMTTFALPDFRGRVPAGAQPRVFNDGTQIGTETTTLTIENMPQHTHELKAGIVSDPSAANFLGSGESVVPAANVYAPVNQSTLTALNENAVGHTGQNLPLNNIQPSICINFIIATQGIFPQRAN